MTDEKIEEVLFDISGKLASIQTKLDNVSEIIIRHESRITMLEQNFTKHISTASDDSFKTQMIQLLGKCLIIGLTTIASLCGAGALISKIITGV